MSALREVDVTTQDGGGLPLVPIPCTDDNAAQLFEAWLRNEGVDVRGTLGSTVLVPTNNPPFAWDVAEAAVSHGFADDETVCSVVGKFPCGVRTVSIWEEMAARALKSHEESVARGEHDEQCEWRPKGFYLCHCSKRRRERDGYTEPPGELIWQNPLCPRCVEEVEHDGDGFTCSRCAVSWHEDNRTAEFIDIYSGDLAADLAEWEAAHARRNATVVELPAVSDVD